VLTGERYKTIAKETAGILKGEYGATPAPVNAALQERVLEGSDPVTCRPADNIPAEFEAQKSELQGLQKEKDLVFGENIDDDVLTYALFPQVGLKFLANRNNPDAFEPPLGIEPVQAAAKSAASTSVSATEVYSVEVEGKQFVVKVSSGGNIESTTPVEAVTPAAVTTHGVTAPLAGNIFKVLVKPGDAVKSGDVVVVLEAMKMETEIRSGEVGTVSEILVQEGDAVGAGDTLITLG
jgi:oxaloacetate decarboxylase alpha subunit